MNISPEITEIKNLLQQQGEVLTQISKDQNYLRGALDQINERFGTLDARMGSLESRMSSLETRVSEVESRLSREIRENFKWTLGMMIPVRFGILVAIIAQFVKG